MKKVSKIWEEELKQEYGKNYKNKFSKEFLGFVKSTDKVTRILSKANINLPEEILKNRNGG